MAIPEWVQYETMTDWFATTSAPGGGGGGSVSAYPPGAGILRVKTDRFEMELTEKDLFHSNRPWRSISALHWKEGWRTI